MINVATATLAALIGAGGLGEPILSGLNLNDPRMILQGAVPAAALALLVQNLTQLIQLGQVSEQDLALALSLTGGAAPVGFPKLTNRVQAHDQLRLGLRKI